MGAPQYLLSTSREFHLLKQDCQCWRHEFKSCDQKKEKQKRNIFEMDIDDIADSTMQVMQICKLRPWEVKLTKPIIKRSFKHFEEVRSRIDRVPVKRFGKENFLHDLAVEAGMSRIDSQLAYGIVKRAFRAYYHGTGEGGKRIKSISKQTRHRSECFWQHAAKRTAEIYAALAGLMNSEQKQYEECIECVYKSLYEALQTRLAYENTELKQCNCNQPELKTEKSFWSGLAGTPVSAMTPPTTELYFNRRKINISRQTSPTSVHLEYTMLSLQQMVSQQFKLKSSYATMKSALSKTWKRSKPRVKCKCMSMECVKEAKPPLITAESSQGPYVCRWVSYDEEEEKFREHHVPCPPMDVICPVCGDDEVSCDDECTCTCQLCQCKPEYGYVEEEHTEKLSGSGLESQDTLFCWWAPFRDTPRVEKEAEVEEVEEEKGEEEESTCQCACEFQQRAYPHLFTYLKPFKSAENSSEKDAKAEELTTTPVITPKVPPCGVSLATYKCWTAPKEEQSVHEVRHPFLSVLSSEPQPEPTNVVKVKGITMEVIVKTQHAQPPEKPAPSRKRKSHNRRRSSKNSSGSNAVQQSTIVALEVDMKNNKAPRTSQAAKNSALAARPAAPTSPPASAPTRPPVKPSTPPNSTPAAAPPAATATRESDTLTKEDIIQMLGLGK